MRKAGTLTAIILGLVTALSVTGCRFERHKGTSDNDNVKFSTPLGGLSVKTDQATVQNGVGLAVYPGATIIQKEGDHDSDAADVNFSFGSFHVGVKALSYQTPDAGDKVMAFYRKDMTKYGNVIQCHGNQPVGQPTQTQDGLTCNIDQKSKTYTINEKNEDQLRAGSRLHQHIVSVVAKDGGTKISLIALDLPGNLGGDDSN